MHVEVTSPDRIELTPECALEDSIVSGKEWNVEIVDPDPLELNVRRLVLTAAEKVEGESGEAPQ